MDQDIPPPSTRGGREILKSSNFAKSLAWGTFRDRAGVLHGLVDLPLIMEAQHDEVLQLIERHRLRGTGIGWLDAHLLASAMLSGIRLWTLDRRLAEAALRLSRHH